MTDSFLRPTPFVPQPLPPLQAHLLNSLCTRRQPWAVTLGDVQGTLEAIPFPSPFERACSLVLRCADHFWIVELDSHDLLRHHPALADVPPDNMLPAPLQLAILELLAAPVLESLQCALKAPIRIERSALFPAPEETNPLPELPNPVCWLQFLLRLPETQQLSGQTCSIRLGVPDREQALWLIEALKTVPRRNEGLPLSETIRSIPIPVSFETGNMSLSRDELESLAVGDTLLPGVYPAAEGRLLLRISGGRGRAIPCTLQNGAVTVTESMVLLEDPMPNDTTPANDTQDQATPPEQHDIELTLRFELEHRLMTLKDLDTLAPGYTFALASDPLAPVTLTVNGKDLGKGRLVDLNGVLGVQITELH